MKSLVRITATLVATFLASPVLAGSRTGAPSFFWDSFLNDLALNIVSVVGGFFAITFLVAAAFSYRNGDMEGVFRRLVGGVVLGGLVLAAPLVVDTYAAAFGAVLSP
ncbi:MAG TPA: TrbC/VirB2 family protein [Thermoanaerobaculia bacterium]